MLEKLIAAEHYFDRYFVFKMKNMQEVSYFFLVFLEELALKPFTVLLKWLNGLCIW